MGSGSHKSTRPTITSSISNLANGAMPRAARKVAIRAKTQILTKALITADESSITRSTKSSGIDRV